MNKKKYIIPFVMIFVSVGFAVYLISWINGKPFVKISREISVRGPASLSNSANILYTHEIEQTAEQNMEKARDLIGSEYYTKANIILSEFLISNPTHPLAEEAYFLLIKGLFEEGEFSKSRKAITDFREQEPDSTSIWMGRSLLILAQIYEKTGQVDEVIQLYRKIISEFSDRDLVEQAEELLMNLSV